MCLSKMWGSDRYKHLMFIKRRLFSRTVISFPKWLEATRWDPGPRLWEHCALFSSRLCPWWAELDSSQSGFWNMTESLLHSCSTYHGLPPRCAVNKLPSQQHPSTNHVHDCLKLSSCSSAQNHCFLPGNTGIHPVQPQSSTGGSSAHLQMHFDISDNSNCWQLWKGPHG